MIGTAFAILAMFLNFKYSFTTLNQGRQLLCGGRLESAPVVQRPERVPAGLRLQVGPGGHPEQGHLLVQQQGQDEEGE